MRGAFEGAHVPHVFVQGCDIPVADQRDARLGIGEPAASLLGEVREPLQLVGVVRVRELSAIGDVQTPGRHRRGLPILRGKRACRVDGGAERSSFDHGRFTEGGLGGEVVLDVQDRQARGDGDAVPLVESVDGDVVSGCLEGSDGELVGSALDFLHGQHVRA